MARAVVVAHDTDEIPHQPPHQVPVASMEHGLARERGGAGIPGRELPVGPRSARSATALAAAISPITAALEQRVAGQPIRAVQRRCRRPRPRRRGPGGRCGLQVGHHAAALVVRRRDDRDRLVGDVDAEMQARLIDGREAVAHGSASRCSRWSRTERSARRFISRSIDRATMSRGARSASVGAEYGAARRKAWW